MIDFLGIFLFCFGCCLFAIMLISDIKSLFLKSRLFFWSCCKRGEKRMKSKKEEDSSK